MDTCRPRARTTDLVVERLADEVLVYDLVRDRAHTLNLTAAMVWDRCDGTRGSGDIALLVEEESGTPVGAEIVELALERLGRAHLLDEGHAEPHTEPVGAASGATGTRPPETRRQALRRMARIGIALPVVLTIVAPTPAQAATRITSGDCFWYFGENNGKCCTNGRRCVRWFSNRGICYGTAC